MARNQFAVGLHIAEGDQAKAPTHHAGRQRRRFRHAEHRAGHELACGIKRRVEAHGQQHRIHAASVFRQRFQQRMSGNDIFHAGCDHGGAEAGCHANDFGAWRSGGTRDRRAGFGDGFCRIRIGNQKAHGRVPDVGVTLPCRKPAAELPPCPDPRRTAGLHQQRHFAGEDPP